MVGSELDLLEVEKKSDSTEENATGKGIISEGS